jgi:hypothetical protein
MEVIKQHIQAYLPSFLNEIQRDFDDVFDIIQNEIKAEYKELLNYLDNTLNNTLQDDNGGLAVLHIHFEDEFSDIEKLLISEYLLVKTFRKYQSTDNTSNEPNLALKDLLAALEAIQNGLERKCPDGASGKNGGNRIWKNWMQDKIQNKSLLEFYKNINENFKSY